MRVFLSANLQAVKKPRLKDIVEEFKVYKETGSPGLTFGRDAEMLRPSSAVFAEVSHVHLLDGTPNYLQGLQIRPQYNRTSDSFLIYCPGFVTVDCYLLIDVLWDDAHAKIENLDLMEEYAKIAERFRKRY